ncbi:MAG: hypothetical protein IJT97_04295 [Bacteroidaceae bacterium]|nr:hypothetical protein [Bacteroidaceae bacterium]
MKRTFFLLMALAAVIAAEAQSQYKGTYFNKDLYIRAKLNLEAKDIPVPGLELDSCYGYLQGSINGSWMIMKVKSVDEKKAVVRAVSERGADAQDLEIQLTEDGISLKQINGTYIKGVAKNKYVKLPKPFMLPREQ